MIYNQIEDLIGDTPLLKISQASHGLTHTDVYVKLEYLNPFGSIKDRTAQGLIKGVDFAALKADQASLIESSSGNTAKALQLIAARQGVNLISITNRVKVPEVDQLLRYIGVDIVSLPGRSECPDPTDEDNALAQIHKRTQTNPGRYHHTNQYANLANPEVHTQTTAHEIYTDLDRVDYVVTGVGTGGSSGGLIEYARKHHHNTKAIGVVSDGGDFLPGIRSESELYETELFNREQFESLEEVSSRDALHALDNLIRNDGILAGPTTGANFAALVRYLENHDQLTSDGSRQVAVFIACDRLEPYMSYITQRLPERFNLQTQTDIFDISSQRNNRRHEKASDSTTEEWITQEGAQVIDMRGVKPYNAFHIKGSLSYPEELLHEVSRQGTPFDRTKPILLVCPRGDRSLLYANLLRQRGLDAYSLAGGLLAWRAAGLHLVRPSHG